MIYGVAIGVGLAVLLLVFALRDRLPGRERPPVRDTGDAGVPLGYVGGSDPSPNYPGPGTGDEWDIGNKVAEDCATAENPGDAEQCDVGDSGSDGGSDGGGGDGGGGGGD